MSHEPVPGSPAQLPWSAVVARLRAAGCVFAEDEARLLIAAARTPADLSDMVDRRAAGQPLEHVVGWADFCGLRIAVDPGVFVPRRRSEFLVSQAAAAARRPGAGPPVVVVDLCCGSGAAGAAVAAALGQVELYCGSGAAGAAVAAALGQVELYCADIDPAAVRCARRNVTAAGGQALQGDLFQPLPARLRGRVDVLIANVPYVPTGEVALLPPEARIYEPRVALDGGPDGLDVLRRVTGEARRWLAPGGSLLVETSERQASQAAEIMAGDGLRPQVASCDELNATVVIGTVVADPVPADSGPAD